MKKIVMAFLLLIMVSCGPCGQSISDTHHVSSDRAVEAMEFFHSLDDSRIRTTYAWEQTLETYGVPNRAVKAKR